MKMTGTIEAGSTRIARARRREPLVRRRSCGGRRARECRGGEHRGGAHRPSPPVIPAVAGRVPQEAVRQVAIA